MGFTFVFWCVLWVRFASKIHSFAWIDTAALFLAYTTYCSYHDATFQFPQNAFMLGIGAMFGVIFLTCIWAVLVGTRFSVRLLPLLLSFVEWSSIHCCQLWVELSCVHFFRCIVCVELCETLA